MIERHLTVPHRFVCFTDRPDGIDPKIEIRILPRRAEIHGWWWKPYMFKADHFPQGDTNLFFDLDMVIIGNINSLISYQPGQFVGLHDFSRIWKNAEKLCSAIMRWEAGFHSEIWEGIGNNPGIIRSMPGDQDWIWSLYKNKIKFYPDRWIISYKWEARERSELARINGRYNFNSIRNVELDPTTSVLAFHGTPNPHEVKDPIIVDNWR